MKILLFDKHAGSQIAAALGAGGHTVAPIKDEKAVLAALAPRDVQALLIVARAADVGVLTMLQLVRKDPAGQRLYVLCAVPDASEELLIRLYRAGADACLRGSFTGALVLAQLFAAARWLDSGPAGAADGQAASLLAPIDRLTQSQTWKGFREAAKSVASTFLSMEVALDEADSIAPALADACSILLSSAQHQLEIRVALGADAPSGKHLAVHVFGPEATDMVPDVLSELANIFMGTLKTSLGNESLAFTGGLPQGLKVDEVLRPALMYANQFAFALKVGDAALLAHVSVRSKANLFIALGGLREGMVLAKDVFNARGLLMAHGGTRLSERMIEKITSVLPPRAQLEVTAP